MKKAEDMTIEEIDEMYDAAKLTTEEAAEMFGLDPDEVDLSDDDMSWVDRIGE
jgi:hypothetical protein